MIDRNGNYIAADEDTEQVGSFYDTLRRCEIEGVDAELLIERIKRKEVARFWCTDELGVRQFVSVKPIENSKWTFVISLEERAFSDRTRQFIILISAIVLILLSVSLFAFLAVQRSNRKNRELYIDRTCRVYNKQYYHDKLVHSTVRGIALIDLDHLKHINDSYGHIVGDWAITETAIAINRNVGGKGLVFRFGGDEFAIVLREPIPTEDFELMLDGILRNVRMIRHEKYPDISLTVSIGGCYERGVAGDVLRNADTLLYRAKEKRDQLVTNLHEL